MNTKIKWLALGVFVSVLLNVFFVGLLVGKEVSPKSKKVNRGSYSHEFNMRAIHKHLTPEQNEMLRQSIKARRIELGKSYQGVRASNQEIKAVISAPEFNRDDLFRALEHRDLALRKGHNPAREVFINLLETLDQETRSRIAEDIFKHPRRSHRSHEREGRMPPRNSDHTDDRKPPEG